MTRAQQYRDFYRKLSAEKRARRATGNPMSGDEQTARARAHYKGNPSPLQRGRKAS